MADNNRAARLNDPRYAAGQSAGASQGDPLAELARLIGQTDPFAEFGKDPRVQQAKAAPPQQSKYVEMAPFAQPQQPAQHYSEQDYAAYAQQQAQHGYADPQQGYADPQQGYHDPNQAYQDQQHGYQDQQHGYQHQDYADPQVGVAHAPYQAPSYAAPGYAAAEPDAHGYQPDPYYGGRQDAPDDEIYDDLPPRRSRRMMLMAVVVLCLAVVGTAGAFAYRSFLGGSRGTTPPVIKADTTPSKVVPAVQTGDANANKLIYDRVAGAAPQGERVVSREEQPIEMKDPRAVPARMVFPPAPGDTTASAAAGGGIALTEPKKIRTVTIRPDSEGNPVTSETPRAPRPVAAPPSRNAPVQLSPQAVQAPPAPAPSRSSSGPMSLAPDAANDQQRPLTTAAMPPQLAAAPAGNGSYLVQVSSQRSESDAMASFRSLQSRFPGQLGSRSAVVRRADLGDKGVYYRSMVGPFASADAANQFCGELKAAGGQCLIQRN